MFHPEFGIRQCKIAVFHSVDHDLFTGIDEAEIRQQLSEGGMQMADAVSGATDAGDGDESAEAGSARQRG